MLESFLIKTLTRNFNFNWSLTQIFSCEYRKIFKNSSFYGAPLVAPSSWASNHWSPSFKIALQVETHTVQDDLKRSFPGYLKSTIGARWCPERDCFNNSGTKIVTLSALNIIMSMFRGSRSELFLGKGVLKICNKCTGEHPWRSVISIKLAWVFSCKFAAYFQNTFS